MHCRRTVSVLILRRCAGSGNPGRVSSAPAFQKTLKHYTGRDGIAARVLVMRETLAARLQNKVLLSEQEQCFHLSLTVEGADCFTFTPGQFISCVAEDARGKQQTRAYSLASAPCGNQFDLCINRVEGGFFSNRLCDMQIGDTVEFHGPHGLFTLQDPLTDSLWLAIGTGIAPFRSFAQWLLDAPSTANQPTKKIWLGFGAEARSGLFYHQEFLRLAAAHPSFHYCPTLREAAEGWEGLLGPVEAHIEAILAEQMAHAAGASAHSQNAPGPFARHAYLCGLREPVTAARERLRALGWQRKQIIAERYD